MNNAWIDPYTHVYEYPNFEANNSYFQLLNQTTAKTLLDEQVCLPILDLCTSLLITVNFLSHANITPPQLKKALPAIQACNTLTGKNEICNRATDAMQAVQDAFLSPYDLGYPDYNPYDLRQRPSANLSTWLAANKPYLARPDVQRAIGAKSPYIDCSTSGPNNVYDAFGSTGDNWRSWLPKLNALVSGGLPTLLWAGDTDTTVDWFGCYAVANKIQYPKRTKFQQKALQKYKTNGKIDGEFKSVGNLNWLRKFLSLIFS